MLKRTLLFTLLLAALVPAGARAAVPGCSDSGDAVYPLSDPAYGTGKMTLPDADPVWLAVFAHGYSHRSDSWVTHMQRAASAGAVAFAMDYRGTYTDGDGDIRGWRVTEGAADMIAVSNEILTACPTIEKVVIYGVSMGGNSSGLALAAGATRSDGATPLFDYWVAAEPAANVTETYHEATAVAPANAFAAKAKADIEEEFGGTFAEHPDRYLAATVVAQAGSISVSALQGVFVVHGVDDGLVPHNQGRELVQALRAFNVPTEMYTVARRNPTGDPDHEGGTTLTENAGKPLFGAAGLGPYPEPLAGHGTESSQTHVVVQTGLDIVLELISGARAHQGNAEWLVDGEAGTIRLI